MKPIYYTMKIEWNHDFLLEKAIRKEMQSRWRLCCFMAPRIYVNDHYYGEEIDYLADILLQIYNHKNI